MTTLALVAAVVAGVVVLTPLADRLRTPQPILLLVYGLLLALLPGLPALRVPADVVLPILLPPLLFAASQRTTPQRFRDAAAPILLLAIGLTLATAGAVAVVAHLAGLPWGAAAVLGAIVAPPDPVAATAVARRLRLPERVVTILEGEGMFNDATALVLYKVALAAALTGGFSAATATLDLVLAVVVGTGAGLLLGWLTKLALTALREPSAETTVTLAMPFVAYLGAEHLGGSGVLAVLGFGLYLRQSGQSALTSRGWLVGRSVWDFADYFITSAVFVLLGFELTRVLEHSSTGADQLRLAAVVLLTVVLVRPLWLFPATALARALARRRSQEVPYGWRETSVVSWAGMRGVVTVATALALPVTTPQGAVWWREAVVLAGLACVLVTLVVQGLSLTPMVRVLRVGTEDQGGTDVLQLRHEAMQAALADLRTRLSDDSSDLALQTAVRTYEARLQAQRTIIEALDRDGGDESAEAAEAEAEDMERRVRAAFQRASDVERDLVLHRRSTGAVSPAVADEVLFDVEVRAARSGP